ncbi:MAG TPA: hypothetical protein VFV05_15420 [Methylomirabilota bacterium]|nr:hypothetical protein [Methylomirabilota bacterium]
MTAIVAAPVGAASTCDPPRGFAAHGRLESGDVVVLFRTRPTTLEVGRHFSVEAVVCADAPPRALRVDAEMPEHRHGMNYRARVSMAGTGRYVAEGLLFHMPGRWQLVFDVERDGRTERLAADILLE